MFTRNSPFTAATVFCLIFFAACSRYETEDGDDCSPEGTYDITYTPESVLVEFPDDSPITGPSRDQFLSVMNVPCDQAHIRREPPYDWTDPESFSDVLTVYVSNATASVTGEDGTQYVGAFVECEANLTASVSLPKTGEELCTEQFGCPETAGDAYLTVEFTRGGLNATLEYDLTIEISGLRLALCSATYNGTGTKR